MSSERWFSELPFGCFTLILIAFVFGRDVSHPQGRFRLWYRDLRSFGAFGATVTKPDFFSLGDDHGGKQKFVAVISSFTFSQRMKLDSIRILSMYQRYLASRLLDGGGQYEWKVDANKSFLPGESIEIPIAFIPEKTGNPGVYGDKNLSGYCLSHGTAHFITIQLIARRRVQQKMLQIFMPSNKPSFDPANGADSGGRFLLFEDMELPHPRSKADK